MEIGVFLLIEPFASVEKQLQRAKEMGFTHADITDTNAGGSMLGSAGFSPTVSLDDNPFDVKRLFDKYELGIRVTTVKLQNIVPPAGPVQEAFEDVNKAIQDRSRLINEGQEAYNQAIPRAKGQAEQLVQTMLAAPSAERPAEQRRHLAALFLAMGDPVSALVQWLRLPESERRADDRLTDPLVVELQRRADSRSEDSIIAARVAARLGLERVYAVDDHTGDRASGDTDTPVFAQEMAQIWDNDAAKRIPARFDALQAKFLADGDVLGWYRAINDEDHLRDDTMTGDFAAAAASALPGNTGRKYLAYWETRNLRMVANLREVIGPGRRVLAIVGVSHTPYYHRNLGMTSDVEQSDLGPVLRD